VNPAAALATALVDELVRCGLREAVLAPGSRSAPLALALYDRAQAGELRLHVRIDERSASFLALGLAKASGRPVVVGCTSGTAAAHFHAAVIEADAAAVPLLVLTADRPPELRGTGANQTIDQLKLYGSAVRWFCEVGVPEARTVPTLTTSTASTASMASTPPMAGYWRSLACRARALAAGIGGGATPPGPVHLNLAFRDPLVPGNGPPDTPGEAGLAGRPGGQPWTRFAAPAAGAAVLDLPWTERGVIVCGDGDYDPGPLAELAAAAGWPLLAEPSSNARRGPNALSAYSYLLDAPDFVATHRPDLIVSAGRPGLSRAQLAFLRGSPVPTPHGSAVPPARHVVLAQGPGRWADPARTATDVAAAVRLVGGVSGTAGSGWLASWRRADAAARAAADAVLDASDSLTEPRLARDLAAALPAGALLWAASSLPIRDLDYQLAPRADIRVLASRGASGIDGLVSAALGAALAHQAAGGGPAFALLGDLALVHDAPGLFFGSAEPVPDLCLVVANNDGGGIFSGLEQASIPGPFERLFGTPHGSGVPQLAEAAGIGWQRLEWAADLPAALAGDGLRIIEVPGERSAGAALRARLNAAVRAALCSSGG
jgi:2-succinyl-5-enolpyruvyl-6-hydroxy-3-cyclohexene-1-carboxylate synthase